MYQFGSCEAIFQQGLPIDLCCLPRVIVLVVVCLGVEMPRFRFMSYLSSLERLLFFRTSERLKAFHFS